MSAQHAWSMPFGTAPLDSGGTRFRLWAPDQRRVHLALDDAQLPMQPVGEGWFERDCDVSAGTRYRFRLEDGTAVPDPASRAQPDGVDGASMVVDPARHLWKTTQWTGRPWHQAVVYELHVGTFGGYRGVIEHLPRLAALGVTAIELMPVAQGPGKRNWGYDGVLPFAPTAAYGTPGDLKLLVDSAHGHGLMVLLDVVYNHFGPHGNHLARYASGFFRSDRHTPWGDAIDFRRPEVRAFFIHNALYWLHEYRFDGLRLDAVHAIEQRDFLEELAVRVRAHTPAGRHLHLVLENDNNDAALLAAGYDAQWNDDAHHVLHVALTGEREGYYADYASPGDGFGPGTQLARWLGEGFVFQGQPSAHRGGTPRGQPSAHLPPTAFVAFLQNHDQVGNRAFGERLSTLAPAERHRVAMALLLLSPQIPLLFMGEEWGSRTPFLYFTDYAEQHPKLAAAVSAGRRREFASFAAFADPSARERIPDPNAADTFRRSVPDFPAALAGEGADYQQWIAGLLSLRQREIVPGLRGATMAGARAIGPAAAHACWRLGDGTLLLLDVNLDQQPVTTAAAGEPSARAAAEGAAARSIYEHAPGQRQAVAGGTLPGCALVVRIAAPAP